MKLIIYIIISTGFILKPSYAGQYDLSVFGGAIVEEELETLLNEAIIPDGLYPFKVFINGIATQSTLVEMADGEICYNFKFIDGVGLRRTESVDDEWVCDTYYQTTHGYREIIDFESSRVDIVIGTNYLPSSNTRPKMSGGLATFINHSESLYYRDNSVTNHSTLYGQVSPEINILYDNWHFRSDSTIFFDESRNDLNFNNTGVTRFFDEHNGRLYIGNRPSSNISRLSDFIVGASWDSDRNNSLDAMSVTLSGHVNDYSKIEVYQRGMLLKKISVPPGNYLIDNVKLVSNSDEISVIHKEDNGTEFTTVTPSPLYDMASIGFDSDFGYRVVAGMVDTLGKGHEGYLEAGLNSNMFNNMLHFDGSAGVSQSIVSINNNLSFSPVKNISLNVKSKLDGYFGFNNDEISKKWNESYNTNVRVGLDEWSLSGGIDLYHTPQVFLNDMSYEYESFNSAKMVKSHYFGVTNSTAGIVNSITYSHSSNSLNQSRDTYVWSSSTNFGKMKVYSQMRREFIEDGRDSTSFHIGLNYQLGSGSHFSSSYNDYSARRTAQLNYNGKLNKQFRYSANSSMNLNDHSQTVGAGLGYWGDSYNSTLSLSKSPNDIYSTFNGGGSVSFNDLQITHGASKISDSIAYINISDDSGAEIDYLTGASIRGPKGSQLIPRSGRMVMPLSSGQKNSISIDSLSIGDDVIPLVSDSSFYVFPGDVHDVHLKVKRNNVYSITIENNSVEYGMAVYDSDGVYIGTVDRAIDILIPNYDPILQYSVKMDNFICKLDVISSSLQNVYGVKYAKAHCVN